VLFGSEFGMTRRSGWYASPRYGKSTARQYRAHQGAHSYWFLATIDEHSDDLGRAWNQVAADIIGEFERGT
jgi:hypothetical protein